MKINIPVVTVRSKNLVEPKKSTEVARKSYEFEDVDLSEFKLSQRTLGMLTECKDVDDRSSAMLAVCMAMVNAGLNNKQIISVLTDSKYALSAAALERRGSRLGAANWVEKYVVLPAKNKMIENMFGESNEAKANTKLNLRFEKFNEIDFEEKRVGLIDGVLDRNSLSVIYGESNVGKSFFAMDLAFHVSTGKSWYGHTTSRSVVVYLALEGGSGGRNRVLALRQKFTSNEDVPFIFASGSFDLNEPAQVELLIREVQLLAEEFKAPLGLIVIDTFSRSLSGADENSSADMGKLIKSLDRLRVAAESAVLLIHHSGKDTKKGARGHSSLRAAVDTEIELKRVGKDEVLGVTKKQRDYETGEKFPFKLEPVTLVNFDNDVCLRSCVVKHLAVSEDSASNKNLSHNSEKGLATLKKMISKSKPSVQIDKWRINFFEEHYSSGKKSTKYEAFKKVRAQLEIAGLITIDNDQVRLVDSGAPSPVRSGTPKGSGTTEG